MHLLTSEAKQTQPHEKSQRIAVLDLDTFIMFKLTISAINALNN